MQRDNELQSIGPPQSAANESKPIDLKDRLALSPREFGVTIGRSATKVYRDIYAGRIKVIADAGRMLIPRAEIDRFLARAVEYNPKRKPKAQQQEPGQPS